MFASASTSTSILAPPNTESIAHLIHEKRQQQLRASLRHIGEIEIIYFKRRPNTRTVAGRSTEERTKQPASQQPSIDDDDDYDYDYYYYYYFALHFYQVPALRMQSITRVRAYCLLSSFVEVVFGRCCCCCLCLRHNKQQQQQR